MGNVDKKVDKVRVDLIICQLGIDGDVDEEIL